VLAGAAREALLAYAWPGNVRQLRMVLRTLVALAECGRVTLDDVPASIRERATAMACVEASPLHAAERQTLLSALEQQRWHMTHTAEQLGVSRNTLYRKLRKYGVGLPGTIRR